MWTDIKSKSTQKGKVIMILSPSISGNQFNRRFCDIFPDVETFVNEYRDSELYGEAVGNTLEHPEIVYYLLYARYGNSTIASFDENQFKYGVYSTMFMYGPTWEKRLEIQSRVRELTEEEIKSGSRRINNLSLNPSDLVENPEAPLATINQQTFNKWERGPLDGYSNLLMLIDTDVTEEFISKFKKLFIKVVSMKRQLPYFITEGDE